MKCNELMKTNVECVRPTDTTTEAAIKMREKNIGFIPVCDASGKVVGTLTDRDLAIRVVAQGIAGDVTLVEQVMTNEVIACRPDDDVDAAEQLMSRYKKSRVLCTDDRGRPVGVISLSDIASIERSGRASAVLQSISQREASVPSRGNP